MSSQEKEDRSTFKERRREPKSLPPRPDLRKRIMDEGEDFADTGEDPDMKKSSYDRCKTNR